MRLILAVAFAFMTAVSQIAPLQRPDPVEDLRLHVLRFTASEPVECGRHVLVERDRQWPLAADGASLEQSVACGLAAASDGRPFWTFKQDQGIDSWIATGLVGTSLGIIYRFTYDSAPCGGPGCHSRIIFDRCDGPSAATGSYERSEFRCAKAVAGAP